MDSDISESSGWLRQAEKDLKAAKDSLSSNNYEWTCFQAQQAAEKALKAVYIEEKKELFKTHDLVFLAREVDASQEIVNAGSELTPVYTDTRYPDVPKSYTKEKAEHLLEKAREVVAWTKLRLSKN